MNRDPFDRRKKIKLVAGVAAVGVLVSVLTAVALYYMGQTHSLF